ncbi:hypothetical protein [Microvirga aerophila]|uniref:Uncharacterized protein n=1 Tax=Microvirga aerophila TaxID=670291 RepID=A0A512BKP0_9HYPH|nr:hypothetical protein [Microvirga aerophila]GEO12536.1 hypothetical protein MAE02_02320 [Microvirga aerophila]
MSQTIRPILTALRWLFVLVFGAIIGEFFVRWADELGFYSAPHLRVTQAAAWLGWAIDTFYLRYVATFLAGLLFGWRIAFMARRQNQDDAAVPKEHLENLGQRSLLLAARIEKHLRTPPALQRGNPEDFMAEISAVLTSYEKLGIASPLIRPNVELTKFIAANSQCFRTLGPLIRDGHIEKARLFASEVNKRVLADLQLDVCTRKT